MGVYEWELAADAERGRAGELLRQRFRESYDTYRSDHSSQSNGWNNSVVQQGRTTVLIIASGGRDLIGATVFPLGDPTVDGSWQIVVSGANLIIQRRESGAWATKSTIVP